jgi:lipid II:glycine glycyltransferase (peptidoglycan interpeptide bridge formation enzyme)
VLGGIVFVYQGITVRALKGASDDEKRNLPINHLVLYEAIKLSKMNGFKYFDLWGYNHFADENNHVYHINFFKKGFGGYYTFFAKKMNIDLVPFGYYLYNFPKSMKESLIKYHLIKS